MRMLFTAISLLVILHVLAAAGFVAWLEFTDRLSEERVEKVVEMFKPTLAEAEQRREQAEQAEARAAEVVEQATRMRDVADGPRTLQQRLADDREADELAEQRYRRLEQEKSVLKGQLARMRRQITKMREELAAEREAFESMVQRQKDLREDADFQQAVELLERVKPEQAKQMFQRLLAQGRTELVVEYLAAMQQRIAAKVLGSFETPEEIAQATELVERLRVRGVEPMSSDSPLVDGADL